LSHNGIVDIAFGTTGDYFAVRNDSLDNQVGAIINIGEDTTNVSVYNKGINLTRLKTYRVALWESQ